METKSSTASSHPFQINRPLLSFNTRRLYVHMSLYSSPHHHLHQSAVTLLPLRRPERKVEVVCILLPAHDFYDQCLSVFLIYSV